MLTSIDREPLKAGLLLQGSTVFDYYNTILHYSDHIYTIFILYGVENQKIFDLAGKEIKGRSTLYTPEALPSSLELEIRHQV